jgi:ABC-type glutathione transport system ATPase component
MQAGRSLTYLYISHDLEPVRHFADYVAVMDRGKIVEQASVSDLRRAQGQTPAFAL